MIMNLFDCFIQFRCHQIFNPRTVIILNPGGIQRFGRDTLNLENNARFPDDRHNIRPPLPIFIIGMYLRNRSQQAYRHAVIERFIIIEYAHTAFKGKPEFPLHRFYIAGHQGI